MRYATRCAVIGSLICAVSTRRDCRTVDWSGRALRQKPNGLTRVIAYLCYDGTQQTMRFAAFEIS